MSGSNVRKKPEDKIVWDAADGGNGPVVKDGVFYPSRRSFLFTFGGIAAAVVGLLTGKGFARQSANDLPRNDHPADHHDTKANHTDLCCPHADGAPHSDFNTRSTNPPTPASGPGDASSRLG
jgi:hypothetical protein